MSYLFLSYVHSFLKHSFAWRYSSSTKPRSTDLNWVHKFVDVAPRLHEAARKHREAPLHSAWRAVDERAETIARLPEASVFIGPQRCGLDAGPTGRSSFDLRTAGRTSRPIISRFADPNSFLDPRRSFHDFRSKWRSRADISLSPSADRVSAGKRGRQRYNPRGEGKSNHPERRSSIRPAVLARDHSWKCPHIPRVHSR